jgi:hypothetical protein
MTDQMAASAVKSPVFQDAIKNSAKNAMSDVVFGDIRRSEQALQKDGSVLEGKFILDISLFYSQIKGSRTLQIY